jgi:hypothetical protein
LGLSLWSHFILGCLPTEIFSVSEIIVAVIIVIPIALFLFINKHINTLIAYHLLIIGGLALSLIFNIILDKKGMPGLVYMVSSGVGLYMGYVPFNSVLFDLLLATFSYSANAGFLMYICDACGYIVSIGVVFGKNFSSGSQSWLQFYINLTYGMTIAGIALILASLVYFVTKYHKLPKKIEDGEENAGVQKEQMEEDSIGSDSGRCSPDMGPDPVQNCTHE